MSSLVLSYLESEKLKESMGGTLGLIQGLSEIRNKLNEFFEGTEAIRTLHNKDNKENVLKSSK